MNNGIPNGQQGLPALTSLIRPDQVRKLPNFPEEQKQKYFQGVTKLWQSIQSNPETSQEHQAAYKKLVEVSMSIKTMMKKQQDSTAASAASAAASVNQMPGRPTSSGQQIPQNAQPIPQPMMPLAPQPTSESGYSEKVMEKVRELNVVIPGNVLQTHGPQARQRYVMEAKNKYAQALQKLETFGVKLNELQNASQTREAQGRPLTPQEQENYQNQKRRLEQGRSEAHTYLLKWTKLQESWRNQPTQVGNTGVKENNMPRESVPKQEPLQQPAGGPSNTPFSAEHLGQAHTVSSALDAARNQGHPEGRAGSPPSNGRPVTQVQSTAPNTYHVTQGQPPNTQTHPNVKAESRLQDTQFNSPHNVPSHVQHQGEPYALSHQSAIEQARSSYPTGNPYPQSTPQSATHGHPPHYNQREQQPNSHSKMPIPKDFSMPVPQPVSMGQARPTLTGGPHAAGPIGQPAIQKHPGYVLEGEGERVLSKKKLEVLVRQVTGGTGAESDEGESLTAEVEETLLQVADEFVDQVIMSACKLAKLRQSSTLELRDIQLILERNYNIRVPGFASDELRTVKRMTPTTAWASKLSAVQAAKVTGGRTD